MCSPGFPRMRHASGEAGQSAGDAQGCSVWHADNVSLGESPPCAAAGTRSPAQASPRRALPPAEQNAQILVPGARRNDGLKNKHQT